MSTARAPGLPPMGARVVVGASAGRDSTLALALAVEALGPGATLAVHVHHARRGAGADADARHVAGLAARLGCACRTVRLAPGPVGAAAARADRRDALRAAARAWGADAGVVAAPAAVVLGHTVDDEAEGVLLRLLAAPGTRALRGMDAEGQDGVWRPLLAAGLGRTDTAAACLARGLSWREDPSNPEGRRGRLRALMPALGAVEPRTVGALVAHARAAREDDGALVELAGALVAADGSLPRAGLDEAPRALARRALRIAVARMAGGPGDPPGGRLEELLALRPGGALDLAGGVRVRRSAHPPDVLRVERTPPRSRPPGPDRPSPR